MKDSGDPLKRGGAQQPASSPCKQPAAPSLLVCPAQRVECLPCFSQPTLRAPLLPGQASVPSSSASFNPQLFNPQKLAFITSLRINIVQQAWPSSQSTMQRGIPEGQPQRQMLYHHPSPHALTLPTLGRWVPADSRKNMMASRKKSCGGQAGGWLGGWPGGCQHDTDVCRCAHGWLGSMADKACPAAADALLAPNGCTHEGQGQVDDGGDDLRWQWEEQGHDS